MSRKSVWNILLAVGIVCYMMNILTCYGSAKGSFSKKAPGGMMATAVGNRVALSWEAVTGAQGYEIYEGIAIEGKISYTKAADIRQCSKVFVRTAAGTTYYYYVRAYTKKAGQSRSYGKAGKEVSTTLPVTGQSTIRNFLQTAIAPIGSTMYVWGGGWNKEDTGAGKEARRIGLSASWRRFAKNKTAKYNYRDYRYRIHDGLDCSGYVGWCVYNIRNTTNNKSGYVYSASKQAKKFAEKGFGTYTERNKVNNYKAGDIMSSTCKCCGHVWIVIGACDDGSVVLVHSSPAGVQLSGTTTPQGKKKSEAYKLAQKYMKKFYKSWYNRYPNVSKGTSYLSHYAQMRWKTTGKGIVLSDPDGYRNMSAEEVLKDLFHWSSN